jgi:hypothetical protein
MLMFEAILLSSYIAAQESRVPLIRREEWRPITSKLMSGPLLHPAPNLHGNIIAKLKARKP